MSEASTFGSWLKQRRRELNITQEELAERVGISGITLRKLEAGERRPSGQIVLLLADFLKVPLDERQAFLAFARTGRQVSDAVNPTAPWRNALRRQTNLPTLLTPIIGREEVEAAALDHLLNPRTRLLTLIGAPGIGKTRLALQVGFDLLADFEDGVFFVDLAPVVDPDMVLSTIARTLGLKETAQQPVESVLLDYLRQRRTLLLLDNFEQVLDASIEVVKLMEASPWLKVLITSREALQVRGERRFFVPPLAVPDLTNLPDLDGLESYPSVYLFVERAQAIAPDFSLVDANAQDVAAVCVGLEGLPLAIELAASQADRLSPSDMRAALSSRLKLLRAETRDLPSRQRTLRGAIEWSYNLLDQRAQRLFRSLGAFVGGFTPEAVDAVRSTAGLGSLGGLGGVGSAQGERTPTLQILGILVAQSLVRQDDLQSNTGTAAALGSHGSGLRFRMWEAIREFASEELRENGERGTVEKAHALYFAELAHEAAPRLVGAEQLEWLNRLEQEHDNLRAALRWAGETSERYLVDSRNNSRAEFVEAAEIGLQLAINLHMFWVIRGYYTEGRDQLQRLLSVAEKLDCSRSLRVQALSRWGAIAHTQGDSSAALSALEQALAGARALDDRHTLAFITNTLGSVAERFEGIEQAQKLYEDSLALARELGDKRIMSGALNNLGGLARRKGEFARARALHEESLALRTELGDKHSVASTLVNLGVVYYTQGDYASARAIHEQSLSLNQEIGDKRAMSFSFTNLGMVAIMQGDFDAAISFQKRCVAIRREIGDRNFILQALNNLGLAYSARRDFEAAHSVYSECLALSREINYNSGVVWGLYHMANVSFMQDNFEGARALFAESHALGRSQQLDRIGLAIGGIAGVGAVAAAIGDAELGVRLLGGVAALSKALTALPDVEDTLVSERAMALARARLPEEVLERAWAEGQHMTLDEASTYALQDR